MLTKEAADKGLNFLTSTIFDVVKIRLCRSRKGETIDKFRLLRNMLSSQPMSFNLFGELLCDLNLATVLARKVWGEHIARVIDVRFEWAPCPKEEFLDDRTAFDVFLEYEVLNGDKGFIGIETKLTEPFSQRECSRDKYDKLTNDSPWYASEHLEKYQSKKFNQIWRNHLLTWALVNSPKYRYSMGELAIVYHPGDKRCAETIEEYQEILPSENRITSMNLQEIVSKWKPLVQTQASGQWLRDFERRYLRLSLSDQDFQRSWSVL